MAMILIDWLYIAVTTFLTGYGILSLFARLTGYRIRHMIPCFLAGLAGVTVYAQFFSLFAGVSTLANIILMAFCLCILAGERKSLLAFALEVSAQWNKEKWKYAAAVCLILLMAYGTSRGYMHFDTGLYHAQSIRWIEEYGVVCGLANIQARFGYNSAAFPLTALYSMKGVFGQSLHATAGFFALIASFMVLDLYKVFTEKRILMADFIRLGLLFYISVIFSEMMSPASDYYAQLLLFMIFILWLEEDEKQKSMNIADAVPYGLICVLAVYAVTIKFSVAVLLLLVIKPAIMLIKGKEGKKIAVFLLTGFLTALPFFIRNVILTGWLVYPFAGIDLFDVDWKIPKGQVEYDATEIGVYGKGLNDVALQDTPYSVWVPDWFGNLKSLEKVFVLVTTAAIVWGVAYLLVQSLRSVRKKKWLLDRDFALVFGVSVIAAAFWFVSAPLIRYGYAYVTVIPLLAFGYFFLQWMKKISKTAYHKILYRVFALAVILFLFTRVTGFAKDIARTCRQPYYIAQMDYVDGEARVRVVDGIAFYEPTEAGQIGYRKFPASLFAMPFELRGDSLEEGFRQPDTE